MIALLAGWILAAETRVFELPAPHEPWVSIQALVRLPDLSQREQGALRMAARMLPSGTDDYSRGKILEITAGGEPLRCRIEADFAVFRLGVLPEKLDLGLSLMASALERPSLSQESFDDAQQTLPYSERDPWSDLFREQVSYLALSRKDVLGVCEKVLRPENVFLSVGGRFESGISSKWQSLTGDWKPRRLRRWPDDQGLSPAPASKELTGWSRRWTFTAADLPKKCLVLTALGAGKNSTLFKTLREKLGVSYRQEAQLLPSRQGFEARFCAAWTSDSQPPDLMPPLTKAVQDWTEQDLHRAQGMFESALLGDMPVNVLWVSGGPLRNDLGTRTFMNAYWPLKTGDAWSPEALVNDAKKVNLEEFKRFAEQMLTEQR